MSTSQPPTAPQASKATAASSSAQASVLQSPALPPRPISRPTPTSPNANTDPTPMTQTAAVSSAGAPGQTATPTAAPPETTTTTTADDPLSFNEKLNAGDRYWKFKFGGMAILIITGLIGIGCAAWLLSTRPEYDGYYSYSSYWSLWPALVSWSVSVAWCAICAIVFVVRKRAVHPGARVSMELLLWLVFIVTAIFVLSALQGVRDYGLYGGPDSWGYDYGSDGGDYVLAPNNTWVWEPDTNSAASSRDCSGIYSLYSELNFNDCAEQDAFVNKLWAEKSHRVHITIAAVVCQFFGLALHFALFVWACVDCHRYNRSKVSKDAEKIAASIVQTMISNGAIIPPPGQAHMKPGMAAGMYYQVPPPQGYPMQPMYMQQVPGQHQSFGQPQQMAQQPYMVPRQYPGGQPAVGAAGSSNEKGAGPRYA